MKGFTLIEVLVTILILSFIVVGIYNVLDIGNIAYSTDLGLLDLQQQTRLAMERMTRETRQSSISGSGINIGAAEITFSTPNSNNIYYYLDTNSHQIIRQFPKGSGADKIIANNISNLNFSLTGSVLQIQLTASQIAANRPVTFSLTEEVRLRN